MSILHHFRNSLMSRRLLIYVAICAFIFSIAITIVQMIYNHQKNLSAIDTTYRYIKQSYVEGISASVFTLDEELLRLQLKGVLNFPNIVYVKVLENRGKTTVLIEEGDANASRNIVRTFELVYSPTNKSFTSYGVLTVVANLGEVYDQMWENGAIVFITSSIGLSFVAICIFSIFQVTLTRHLIAMCDFTNKLNLNQLDTEYKLCRRIPRLWPDDELQKLASALNKMRVRLKKDFYHLQLSEDELRKSSESLRRYEHIISSTNDLMSFVDQEYRYLAVNNAYLQAHAKERDEIVGNKVEQLMSSEIFHNIVRPYLDRALSGETVQYQSFFEYTGTGRRYMDVTYHPFKSENGDIKGIVVSVHDITNLKQAEKERIRLEGQLRQAQKIESIGTLAGGIAHDFNNILSAILGYTELAMGDFEAGSDIRVHLHGIYTAGNRAKDLVRQILAFARQSDEKLNPIQVPIIVKEVLRFIRSSIPATIEIKCCIESDSLIMANATQVYQVMMNLCSNAAQAMENEGGILSVTLHDIVIDQNQRWQKMNLPPGKYIALRVSDTGPGIAPEIINTIFEPYFTTKGPGEGTGMGLAVANGIVESYNGKIIVQSKPGQKTVFTVYLPVTKNHMAHKPFQPKVLPKGTERILFVDDETSIASMSEMILKRLGYCVEAMTSSIEALKRFRSTPENYDLVITDMTMPHMTGDVLAAEMIAIRPNIPIIMCSGYSKKISEYTAKQIGIKSFAYKPIGAADLAKTIRRVLDETRNMNYSHGAPVRSIS